MAHLIDGHELSTAWLGAMKILLEAPKGKLVNVNVAFPVSAADDQPHPVRDVLDAFLSECDLRSEDKDIWQVGTVANTIFPEALYHPHLGPKAAPLLYENYELSMRMHRRRARDKDTYFNRLVAYPVGPGAAPDPKGILKPDGSFNQLAFFIDRLRKQNKKGHLSSAYEMGVSHPIDGELRVQAPWIDKRTMWFPCLSHVSLTLDGGVVNMTATYRNQTFVSRAYGNYVGLSRLLRFVAAESGTEAGELQVTATHADAEIDALTKTAVRELLRHCDATIAEPQPEVANA